MKPRVLVFADWYLPGYKAGGAVSAISNLIELVGDEFEFWVFTRDRDLTDREPYTSVPLNHWVTVGKAQVFYTCEISLRSLLRKVREIHPDIIYLNSFFRGLPFERCCFASSVFCRQQVSSSLHAASFHPGRWS